MLRRRTGRFEVYRDAVAHWRWRLIAGNGEIVAMSEDYPSKAGAVRGARDAQRAAARAVVDDVTR